MTEPQYPMNPEQWRSAISDGLGLTDDSAREAVAKDEFPCEQLRAWIEGTYTASVGAAFVQAVVRNIRGLVLWAYGEGSEPHWPGSDDDVY